ncbi:hypothetical protein [Roseibium album]|uniref:hypothetical protein n=1 Tax=Roseibium album TaxID=311410 RepID=UPI00248FDCBD|nr:hypothetical protein [Roseibium album]
MSAEIEKSYRDFEKRWQEQRKKSECDLKSSAIFKLSFKRLIAMQAWRVELFDELMPSGASEFVLEAQNDLLIAHIQARSGQWRSALQAQRAAIENYLNSLFFLDHPIELRLWNKGSFRTTFSELCKYIEGYPFDIYVQENDSGLGQIKKEYALLSMAVHGSAKSFRMTKSGGASFFTADQMSLGKWNTRNRLLVKAINSILLCFFYKYLLGAKKRNLRKSIGLIMSPKEKKKVKQTYGVNIL